MDPAPGTTEGHRPVTVFPNRHGRWGAYYNTKRHRPQHRFWDGPTVCGATDSALQHPAQQLDVLGERRIGKGKLLDFAHRMHDGGMIATAEFLANLG
jgi:hypothetical protein